jgi:hypothetical protein
MGKRKYNNLSGFKTLSDDVRFRCGGDEGYQKVTPTSCLYTLFKYTPVMLPP